MGPEDPEDAAGRPQATGLAKLTTCAKIVAIQTLQVHENTRF